MSTDAENAQAAAEGYWPVEGHETHGIDAFMMRRIVADFIARHPAPTAPVVPDESAAPLNAESARRRRVA